jgi:hypothetical protein
MGLVIKTCVILHNMIIDFQCANNVNPDYIGEDIYVPQHAFTIIPHNPDHLCEDRATMILEMQHQETHNQLQHDLMIEMWEKWSDDNVPGADDDDGMLDDAEEELD